MKNLSFKNSVALIGLILILGTVAVFSVNGQDAKPTPKPTASVTPTPTPTPAPTSVAVWKTIKVGKKSPDELLAALKGFYVSASAKEWIGKIVPVASSAKETLLVEDSDFNLVLLSGTQLGLTGDSTQKQISDAATKLKLSLCPAAVGPYLRYQYTDQPVGDRIFIAMDPMTYQDARSRVFTLERDATGAWLYTMSGFLSIKPSEDVWPVETKWVFVKPKPPVS